MVSSVQEINDLISVKSRDKKDGSILPIGFEERDLFVDRFTAYYRPKVKKPLAKDTKAPAQGTPAKTTTPSTASKSVPATTQKVITTAPADEPEEEEVKVADKNTKSATKDTKVATDPKAKDTKTAAKTTATDPKAKPGAKVAQTPPAKAPAKKKEKEEEKEGF